MAVNYTLSPQVTYRSEYFGALVFHRASWGIYTVNETGFAILKLLSKRNVSREHMHQLLGSVYAHLKDAQMYEIDIFFDRLLALGVIVEKPETDDGSVLNLDPIAGLTEPSISRTIPRHLSSPTFVWWDITSTCNLRCRHCYSNSGASLHDELTTEEVKHILDQLAIMNVFYVYILGGEPFLRKDFMDILGYCRSLNIEVMVSSNGWFITADLACTLARLGIRHVRVSIDGATAKTHDAIRGVNGSFDRAVAAVRNLKRAGVPVVGISPTLMKENVHEAEMLIELAHDLQVDELQFVQVCAVGRAKQISVLDSSAIDAEGSDRRKSAELVQDLLITGSEGIWEKPFARCVMEGRMVPHIMGCGAGRTCLAISPNGRVRACLLFQYEIGDLRDHDLQEIWLGAGHPKIQWLRSIKEGCEGCRYAAVCSGPCPMQQIITPEQRACYVRLEQNKGG